MKLSLHQYIGLAIVTVIFITACQSGIPNSRNLESVRSPSSDCRVVKHAGGDTHYGLVSLVGLWLIFSF